MYFKPDHFKQRSTIINIIITIIIIICKFHARVCPLLRDDTKQLCLVPSSNQSEGRYSMVQDRSPCSGSWVHIVQWGSFSLYHSVSGFLIAASKALRWSSFGKALITWPNKYHWFRLLISPEKNINLEAHLLVQIAIHFKIQYFFQFQLRNMHFQQQQKYIFLFFIVSNLVFIYFRVSTSNFRLLYLIVDYMIDNLKLSFS